MQVDSQRLPDRREAEEDARRDRHGEHERQDSKIEDRVEPVRRPGGKEEIGNSVTYPVADQHAERAARDPKNEPFDQQLTRQACAAGAEGQSHTQFASARRGAREEQVRDIRAGGEQHDADEREQHRHVVDADRTADDAGIAAEAARPVRITHHRNGLGPSTPIVRGQDRSAGDRHDAECFVGAARDEIHGDPVPPGRRPAR